MTKRRGRPVSAHLRSQETQTFSHGGHAEGLGLNSEDDDGTTITFSDWSAENKLQTIRLNLFQECPALVLPCAAFVLDRGEKLRPATREALIKKLRYLSSFITAYGASYGIRVTEYSHFSTRFMEDFLNWLRGRGDVRPRVNDNGGLSKLNAGNVYKMARDLIRWISENEQYSSIAPNEISFNLNPSDKGYKDVKPRAGLPEADLKKIRQACFKELAVTFKKLKYGRAIIEDATIVVPDLTSAPKEFSSFGVCLKAYHSVHHLKLSPENFTRKYPGLKRALKPPYNLLGDVQEHLHFTARSIVPAMVLLAMHFGFEPDSFVQLDWSGEKDSQLYGAARGVVTRVKYRGGLRKKSKSYARTDKSDFSPATIFNMLREISTHTAKLISLDCSKIFCFTGRTGDFVFFKTAGEFNPSLRRFIKANKLPKFTLSSFRKAGGDIVGRLTGGDVAAQKEHQQHESLATTLNSYQDVSNISRREDNLAVSMNVRARRLKNGGKIDTRGGGLPVEKKLAATMGFYCISPYNSPQDGQTVGQLCQAYGRCPACPLAVIERHSAHDCCRLHQLRTKLIEARSTVDPARWQKHWLPQLTALDDDWLRAFTSASQKKASSMVLPPIPTVD